MLKIAVWTPGEIFNLTWTSREYSPVNAWKNVTNSNLLDSYLARAIGVVLGRAYVQLVNEDLGYVMSLLELVSCACGVDRNTTNIDCFAFLSDVGYLAREITQLTAFNGRLTSSSTQVGSITVCSACLDQSTSGITVGPPPPPLSNLISHFLIWQLSKVFAFSVTDDKSYNVVRDSDGNIIGQIIGDGFQVNFDAGITQYQISLPQRSDIERSSQYIIPGMITTHTLVTSQLTIPYFFFIALVKWNPTAHRKRGSSSGSLTVYTQSVSVGNSGSTQGSTDSSGVYFAALLGSSSNQPNTPMKKRSFSHPLALSPSGGGGGLTTESTGILAGTLGLFGLVVVVLLVAAVLILFRKRISYLFKSKEFRRDSYSSSSISRKGSVNFTVEYLDEEEVLLQEAGRMADDEQL